MAFSLELEGNWDRDEAVEVARSARMENGVGTRSGVKTTKKTRQKSAQGPLLLGEFPNQ